MTFDARSRAPMGRVGRRPGRPCCGRLRSIVRWVTKIESVDVSYYIYIILEKCQTDSPVTKTCGRNAAETGKVTSDKKQVSSLTDIAEFRNILIRQPGGFVTRCTSD